MDTGELLSLSPATQNCRMNVDKTVQKRSKKGRVFNYMPHLVWEKVSAANLHICEKFNLVPIFILSALEAG